MERGIEELISFGFPPRVVELWRKSGVHQLLPLQRQAIRDHGFLHGADLLVVAPTASGKTFVAEMAALRHLENHRRVIYLVPTRALAEEKYRQFHHRYAPLGYRIAVATRERRSADRLVMEARFDLLVAVYEKMKAYLVARSEILRDVALVVADEVQTVAEPARGDAIDLLLTKIALAPYRCQLIALSAVVGRDAARIADWLRCELLLHPRRPVELREGVYDIQRRKFAYRAFNDGQPGEENMTADTDPFPGEPTDEEMADFGRHAIFQLIEHLALLNREQVLVFVPTRYTSRNWAHLLAAGIDLGADEDLVRELDTYEDSHSRQWLRDMVRKGIAFHNADLSWDLRELIEHHFNAGAIRVLVSTSTLGQGVNLSGRNVIHVPAMVTTDEWTGRHTVVALTRARFRNQGGRAARHGHPDDFGRSILVARNKDEADRLIREYVEAELEPLEGQITIDALEPHVLDLVVSRVARDLPALIEILNHTFSGRMRWQIESAALARAVLAAVESLCAAGFLTRETPQGPFAAAGLGEVAAGAGLMRSSIERLVQWLRQTAAHGAPDPLETLLVIASTPDGRDFPAGAPDPRSGQAQALVIAVRERLAQPVPLVRQMLEPAGGFSREAFLDLRKACVLDEWISPADTRDIEERHGIFSGAVANLASHCAWIAQGAAAIARALVLPAPCAAALDQLVDRLVLGCGADALGLRDLRVQGLSRSYLQALVREGYATPADLAETSPENLAHLMPLRVARRVVEEARRMADEDRAPQTPPVAGLEEKTIAPPPVPPMESESPIPVPRPPAPPLTDAPLLEVDLRGAGHARFGGRDLALPPLSFRLLALLARSPGVGAAYEEIEACLWPDAQVERQQVLSHRKRLLAELAQVVGESEARKIVRVAAGRGLALSLPADRLRLIS